MSVSFFKFLFLNFSYFWVQQKVLIGSVVFSAFLFPVAQRHDMQKYWYKSILLIFCFWWSASQCIYLIYFTGFTDCLRWIRLVKKICCTHSESLLQRQKCVCVSALCVFVNICFDVGESPQVKEIWLVQTRWRRSRWLRPTPTSRPWPTATCSTSASKASARSSDFTPSTLRSSSVRYSTTWRTTCERAMGLMWVHTFMWELKNREIWSNFLRFHVSFWLQTLLPQSNLLRIDEVSQNKCASCQFSMEAERRLKPCRVSTAY